MPVAIALRGMLGCCGPNESPSCASVSPPCSLIARMPSDPSPSPPDNTIPAAYSSWSRASEAKKTSIGLRSRCSPSGLFSVSLPLSMPIRQSAGMT